MEETKSKGEFSAPLSITEAAQSLGVSERTVYRMIRAGKLQRVKLSDIDGRRVKKVGVDTSQIEISRNDFMSEMSDNLSDNASQEVIGTLREEMREKDAQIAKLMENQSEMMQTIQRLQEQMYELARLVLSQNAASTPASTPPTAKKKDEKQGLLGRLFRGNDNK